MAPIGVPAGYYASSTKLSNLRALTAPSVPLTPAAPPWLTLRPSCWPPRHTECASPQCASHLSKVGQVQTGESDTMTTPVYSAVATTGRNHRTQRRGSPAQGQKTLFLHRGLPVEKSSRKDEQFSRSHRAAFCGAITIPINEAFRWHTIQKHHLQYDILNFT